MDWGEQSYALYEALKGVNMSNSDDFFWDGRSDTKLTHNRFNWKARIRLFIGLRPFRRCPGVHRVLNYPEYVDAGSDAAFCLDCRQTWGKRFTKSTPDAIFLSIIGEIQDIAEPESLAILDLDFVRLV